MQTIQCYRCGHVFDTSYTKHCLCKACRVSIAVPDARRTYVNSLGMKSGAAQTQVSSPLAGRIAPKPGSGTNLPAPVRDEHGQPVKPAPKPYEAERPPHVADDYSFIARRAKQLAEEAAARVAGGSLDDEEIGF